MVKATEEVIENIKHRITIQSGILFLRIIVKKPIPDLYKIVYEVPV